MIRKLRFYRTFQLEVVCVNRCGSVISALQVGRLHTYISSRYQRFITNRSTSHLHNAEKNIVSSRKIANTVLKWLNTLISLTSRTRPLSYLVCPLVTKYRIWIGIFASFVWWMTWSIAECLGQEIVFGLDHTYNVKHTEIQSNTHHGKKHQRFVRFLSRPVINYIIVNWKAIVFSGCGLLLLLLLLWWCLTAVAFQYILHYRHLLNWSITILYFTWKKKMY